MKTLEQIFRRNLVRLRGNRTQAVIAEAAGIPLRSYQHVESTGAIPQSPNRLAIAKALGVNEADLFVDHSEYGAKKIHSPREALKIIEAFLTSQGL